MFVKVDECLPGSLLPSAVSSEHRPSLPQGGEGFSLSGASVCAHCTEWPGTECVDPGCVVYRAVDQLDLFRPRFIQRELGIPASTMVQPLRAES